MRTWNKVLAGISVIVMASVFSGCATSQEWKLSWRKQFDRRLPVMGVGNWIIVAESAYPCRHASGVETIAAEKALPSVLDYVLSNIDDSVHAVATAWISTELEKIPDRDALKITEMNREIRALLNDAKITTKTATEQEIRKMVEAGTAEYNVLIIKTETPLPYTSVYLQLDRRYWDEEREKRLRDVLRSVE